MNDQKFAEQQARIERLAEKWLGPLGLLYWHVKFIYQRNEPPSTYDVSHGLGTTAAVTTTLWQYMEAQTTWNLPAVTAMEDEELELLFLHEMMHVFLEETFPAESTEEARSHNERVASMLAKAFQWCDKQLYTAIYRDPGKPDGAND